VTGVGVVLVVLDMHGSCDGSADESVVRRLNAATRA
jgi:hypothetical protein